MSLDPLNDALVTTDQDDYAPGSTATITATGFGIGDPLLFEISVIDPATGTVLWSGPSWAAYSDDTGALLTSFWVGSNYADTTIQLTVTDLTTGEVATTVFTDAQPPHDPATLAVNETATLTSENQVEVNGAIFKAIDTGATGTGVIDSFLVLQQHGSAETSQGYNTDFRSENPHAAPLDDKTEANFVHSIQLKDVPLVYADGTLVDDGNPNDLPTYYQFNLDINEDQHQPLISLDALQIWVADSGNLGTYVPGANPDQGTGTFAGATLVYNLDDPANEEDNYVSIDTGPGSGHGDIAVLIPSTDFGSDPDQYVYLYSAFGYQDGQDVSSGGFEEWWVPPTATITHFSWSFEKTFTVDPADDASATDPDVGTGYIIPVGTADPGDTLHPVSVDDVNLIDFAGQIIHYTVVLTNDGDNPIGSVTVTDSLIDPVANIAALPEAADSGGVIWLDTAANFIESWTYTYNSVSTTITLTVTPLDAGFTGSLNDDVLDPHEVWTWTYDYAATQADIDNNGTNDSLNPGFGLPGASDDAEGGTQGYIDNTAHVVTTDSAAVAGLGAASSVYTSTQAPVEYEPSWDFFKDVKTVDANTNDHCDPTTVHEDHGTLPGYGDEEPGTAVISYAGQQITYVVTLYNDGNVSIHDIAVTDSLYGGDLGNPDIHPLDVTMTASGGAGDNTDNILDSGETWTWTYTYTVTQPDIDNNGNATYDFDGVGGNDPVGVIQNTATVHSDDPNLLGDPETTDDDLIPNNVALHTDIAVCQDPDIKVEKLVSVDGGVNWYTVTDDGAADDSANLAAIAVAMGIDVSFLHYGTPVALDADVEYAIVTFNTGNVTLTDVTLHDANVGAIDGQILPDPIAPDDSEVFYSGPVDTKSGGLINTVSVTDDQNVGDDDQAAYTTPTPGLPGLTKGFWGTHQYVWDKVTTDDWWSGTQAPKSNPYGNEGQLYFGLNNPKNVISGPNDLNPVKYLELGDLDHNGTGDVAGLHGASPPWPAVWDNTTGGLKFQLDAAAATLNSSTTSDARLILASQALAAELNMYNTGYEPNGLLEAAVQWLTGSTNAVAGELNPLPISGTQPGGSNNSKTVTASSNIDLNHNGCLDLTSEYTLSSKGVITFTGPALSSSNNAFQGYVDIHDVGSTHYYANANGLANALAAFNQGQIVISSDGQYIEWAGTNDWVANDPGAFWEVAYGHIAGVHI